MRLRRDPYWWTKAGQSRLTRLSGGRLLAFQRHRHGLVDTDDISHACDEINTIVDVGANTGQSAIRFRIAFPCARIVSLEPIRQTFVDLQRRTADLNIECHQLAIGTANTVATMYLTTFSETSSLIRPPDHEVTGIEKVQVQTLDTFIREQNIGIIDLLKIDAEGADLDVVKSGRGALESGRVRAVMAEVGFLPGDNRHPLVDDVRDILIPYGFRLFGIYGQNLEWTGVPAVRFANAIFWNQQMNGNRTP